MYGPLRSTPLVVGTASHSSVHTTDGASPANISSNSCRELRRWTPTWMLSYPGKLSLAPHARPGRLEPSIRICTSPACQPQPVANRVSGRDGAAPGGTAMLVGVHAALRLAEPGTASIGKRREVRRSAPALGVHVRREPRHVRGGCQ